MTTPPTLSAPFGMTLAYAERTLTATLRKHLAKRGVTPPTWYALNLIALRGPGLDRQWLTGELEESRTLNPDSVRELLAGLEAEGLIQGDAQVDLTADGKDRHRSLREYIAGPTAKLLGQFPVEDLETTVRTLRAITERADEELETG
jgi:DNA-binding MarR family transcriptional regulator